MNASETFNGKIERVNTQIKRLQAEIKRLKAEQAKNPDNWGFVGTISHIQNQLADILSGLIEEGEEIF